MHHSSHSMALCLMPRCAGGLDTKAWAGAVRYSARHAQRECPRPWLSLPLQDKYRQKQHFAEAGSIPLPEFRDIKCAKCAEGAGRDFGFPFMLKSKT